MVNRPSTELGTVSLSNRYSQESCVERFTLNE